jgi:hypothetical protein
MADLTWSVIPNRYRLGRFLGDSRIAADPTRVVEIHGKLHTESTGPAHLRVRIANWSCASGFYPVSSDKEFFVRLQVACECVPRFAAFR